MATVCIANPTLRRTAEASAMTSSPATRAVPDVGRRSVARIRIVVVLPAPFGPRKPRNVPAVTENEIPSTARVPPGYTLTSSSTSTTGVLTRGIARRQATTYPRRPSRGRLARPYAARPQTRPYRKNEQKHGIGRMQRGDEGRAVTRIRERCLHDVQDEQADRQPDLAPGQPPYQRGDEDRQGEQAHDFVPERDMCSEVSRATQLAQGRPREERLNHDPGCEQPSRPDMRPSPVRRHHPALHSCSTGTRTTVCHPSHGSVTDGNRGVSDRSGSRPGSAVTRGAARRG